MTLQSLGKYLDKYDSQLSSVAANKQLELLQGLPFYDWPLLQKPSATKSYQSGKSLVTGLYQQLRTFNHAIGLPQKNGQPFPLFDYEQPLYNELQQHKHIWIKKATGLGVTEFMLRYMAWLRFNGGSNSGSRIAAGSQMCIVTVDHHH